MTVVVVYHKMQYLSLDLTVHVSGLNWFQCSWLQSKVKTHLFSIEHYWCCIMLLKLCPQNGWREIAGYSRNSPVMCFPLCSTCGTVMWKTSLHRFVLYNWRLILFHDFSVIIACSILITCKNPHYFSTLTFLSVQVLNLWIFAFMYNSNLCLFFA